VLNHNLKVTVIRQLGLLMVANHFNGNMLATNYTQHVQSETMQ